MFSKSIHILLAILNVIDALMPPATLRSFGITDRKSMLFRAESLVNERLERRLLF